MEKIELFRYLIKCASREGTNKYNQILKPLGITANQSEVLLILASHEPLSLKELGDLLICEKKSPSRLVQKLVDKKLVYKSQSLDDSRKSVLHLTQEGRNLIPEIHQLETVFNTTISEIFDDTTIDSLISFFEQYIKNTDSELKIELRNRVEKNFSN